MKFVSPHISHTLEFFLNKISLLYKISVHLSPITQSPCAKICLKRLSGGFGVNDGGPGGVKILDLRQVKIVDGEGHLRRVYPAKGDLLFDASELVAVELQQ